MDSRLTGALSLAFQATEFRAGLHEMIDLPTTRVLLLALSSPNGVAADQIVELLEAATSNAQIQRALLLPIQDKAIRDLLVRWIAGSPDIDHDLGEAIGLLLADQQVRDDLRIVMETPEIRAVIWSTVRAWMSGSRQTLIRQSITLLIRHRQVIKLGLALRRHGVLKMLRRSQK